MKFLLSLVTATLLFASNEAALKAYKNKEYKKAFTLYEKEAKKGDTTAMNALSYLYYNGIGVEQDTNQSVNYLKEAADAQDKQACLDLGLFYLQGVRVAKEYKEAAHYLECAADKGSAEAQYNLALMYYNGDGVKQDVKKAAALLEEAAKSGHKGAKANVGRIYMQALDFKKAKEWLEKNVADGDKEAELLLKEIAATPKE
jgi:TPR repeat protein